MQENPNNFQLPITDIYYVDDDSDDIKSITTKEIFLGKRSVLVMVPGAFTPTCSSRHVNRALGSAV